MKLDFCVVGPQRTGSSWLDLMLRCHPKVILPSKVKETFYWDQKYHKGWEYYSNLFPNDQIDLNSKKVGEIGPTYFHQDVVIDRIYNHNSSCKIVIIKRDPIEKAISLYTHHRSKGRVKSIRDAVKKYPEIIESGKYNKWIKKWTDKFQQENVLILDYKDISFNPQGFIFSVLNYLQVSKMEIPTSKIESKYGERTLPRFPILAKLLASGATFLRRHDLHWLAVLGKRMGLKKAYTGRRIDNILTNEEMEWLKEQFQEKY